MSWQFTEAKNRFSEVVTRALTQGPQRIGRRDQVVVLLSEADYDRLAGHHQTFKDYLLSVPDLSGLDLTRDESPMRDVTW
jgi:antitoxin Phd